MFRLFWICIVICLIAGVIYLGTNIFTRSSLMESDLARKKTHVAEKALELKAKALQLRQKFQNVHKIVNDSLDKMSVDGKSDEANKDAKSKPDSLSTKDGTSKPPVTLKPLDEEDRQLTAEVMGEDQAADNALTGKSEEPAQTTKKESSSSTIEHSGAEEEVGQRENEQPVDLDRLNKIRDLYAKTIEILRLN